MGIYIRDELMTWQNIVRKPIATAGTAKMREMVNQNVRICLHRANIMSCNTEKGKALEGHTEPVYQSILDLMSQATNPLKLAQMDISFLPQL